MKKLSVIGTLFIVAISCSMCRKAQPLEDNANDYDPRLSGGAATTFDISSGSFSNAIEGLSGWDQHIHELGDKFFEQSFVSAGVPLYGGLGPIYNNTSCASCHHNDGMGIPTAGAINSSLLIRLSMPGEDEHCGPKPVPGFGGQLQDQAVYGVQPEAKVNIIYEEIPYTFPDGTTVSLRKPTYTLTDAYIPLPAGYMLSPRMARPVFGLGLLADVPEATIVSFADPADANGDGIKGHPNYVYDSYTKQTELGRFGLKANTPTLLTQVTAAMQQDMGLTNYVFPQESSTGQSQYQYAKDGVGTELADSVVDAVRFYVQSLAVPARRNVTNAQVEHGAELFTQLNCSGCHRPSMYTGIDIKMPTLSHQLIHPYTDLLLHDMGDGLADGRPDYRATGSEWRTTPLWGIGLFAKVNGNNTFYLHDGRARTLTEAILWHGGEAEKSKEQFTQLSKTDRDALIAFLQSL